MQDKIEDTNAVQTLEEIAQLGLEASVDRLLEETDGKAVFPDAARNGIKCSMSEFYELRRRWASKRGRGSDESPLNGSSGESATGSVNLVKGSPQRPASMKGQVMGGLTIRELEMMRKMDEIDRLEEIPVGGITSIEPEVIGAIAGVAAQSVAGVASLGNASLRRTIRERFGHAERRARGVDVEAGRREAILDINVRVVYGYSIPQTVISVRQVVADRLLNLCGLVAKEINVRVTSIEFPPRMPGRVQ
jgi:uncharacterized alkaline shock family protein YloU